MRKTVRLQASNPMLEFPLSNSPKQVEDVIILDIPHLEILQLQDGDYPDDDVLGVPSCCFDN